MLAKSANLWTAAGLLLTLGGAAVTLPAPRAAAAPLARVDADDNADIERTGNSDIAKVRLPAGAHRAKNAGDLAKFEAALQSNANANYGCISRMEVLIWRGGEAKRAVKSLPEQMKESGYTLVSMPTVDAEPGRITPVAAIRKDKTGTLMGMWIETRDGYALLAWGLYDPDNPENPGTPAKPGMTPKRLSASGASSAKSGESDAEKRAKALKAYNDYQYVKLMGPISGPMYRSTKW